MRRLHHVLDNMPHRCSEEKESLRNSEQLMATSKSEYGKPFDREAELYEKQARLEVLNELLDLDRQNEQRDEDEIAVEPNQPVVSSVSAPVVLDSMTEEKSAYAEQNAEQEEKTYHSLSELLRNAADRQSHQATHESGPSVEQQRS